MIEQDIADHLRSESLGDTSNATRQAARAQFRHLAGRVYLGRLPENQLPIGVAVRRISAGVTNLLTAENTVAQPMVEFLIAGRDDNHGLTVLELAEHLRLIFSGYRGVLGTATFCHGCTLERSASLVPARLGDGSDRWVHVFAMDFRFSIDQQVA